jgi:DnaJ-class molecular chaperone
MRFHCRDKYGISKMTFGKRFSAHNNRMPAVVERTCVRCCGTGHIRERGNRIVCVACAGRGRMTLEAKRAS